MQLKKQKVIENEELLPNSVTHFVCNFVRDLCAWIYNVPSNRLFLFEIRSSMYISLD